MGQGIVKLNGKYMIWSTVVDAPITRLMTREQLEEHVRFEDGERGVRELPERMKRADTKGTSFFDYDSAEKVVSHNRSGPDESCLTIEELIEKCEAEE